MAYPPVILFFTVPLTIPEVTLFYHEPLRTETFKTASLVWIIGMDVPAVFTVLRIFAVHRVIGKYAGCTAGHILAVYDECIRQVKLKHTPPLLFGEIKDPACVITTWRSYIVLQERTIRELTDDELKTVLIHELLHIKRKHTVLERVFYFVCCAHWFNPFIWIGLRDFSTACEIDCDGSVLKVFDGELKAVAYAKTMVRLMELAAAKNKSLRGTLGALDFWVAKHRIYNLLNKPSKLQKMLAAFACAAVICGTVWMSIGLSRSYFYPYSGISNGTEWSVANE